MGIVKHVCIGAPRTRHVALDIRGFTGKPPFAKARYAQTLLAHLHETALPLSSTEGYRRTSPHSLAIPHAPPHVRRRLMPCRFRHGLIVATEGTLTMLDRREFLSTAAAVAALTLASTRDSERDQTTDSPGLAQPELLSALGPVAVREIGEAYRALVPAESDRSTLETALRAELRAGRAPHEDPVRADFAAGRTIVVHEWVLSRTEARQCALFSLRPA